MAKNSKIDWIENTWNPWLGCSPTSNPGCQECYAIHRLLPKQGIQPGEVRRTGTSSWQAPLKWQAKAEADGRVESVFMSLCDFFYPVPEGWRNEAWQIIRATPNLQWVILTQRVGNISHSLPDDWGAGYPNVWLGVSASDQVHADKRIPALLKIPAIKHVVSLEPLREKIILREGWLTNHIRPTKPLQWEHVPDGCKPPALLGSTQSRLDWIITGGASGDNWMNWRLYPNWVRSLRDQSVEAGIPFFFKQLGGPAHAYRNGDQAILDGQLWQQIPEHTCSVAKQSNLL